MSSRKPDLYLQDILQACDDILNFTSEIRSAVELQNDRRTFLAVVHSLQTIGEAARQMPKSFRDRHPDIPWRETAGLRNVIAHEYFGLDIDIIWDVVQTRIKPLGSKYVKSARSNSPRGEYQARRNVGRGEMQRSPLSWEGSFL